MSAAAFVHTVLPGRGRALVAARSIRPGEEVLREEPAAMVLSTEDNVDDCHRMLARIVYAGSTERYRQPIADLVCMQDRFHAADPVMLQQLARTGTPAVRSLIEARHGQDAAGCVSEEAVVSAFCKHALNSMTVLTPESCSREVGMALYPMHGALMNHADLPNCWTMFEKAGEDAENPTHILVVRCLSPIAAGEEITISYLDPGQPRSELHQQLESQYFIPAPASSSLSHGACSVPKAKPEDLQRIAARPIYASTCRSLDLHARDDSWQPGTHTWRCVALITAGVWH
jgi:hypothetical protein